MKQPSTMTADISKLLDQSRWLSGLAGQLVADASSADDLVQDTLLAAMEAHRKPQNSGLRAWLATIMRNKAISGQRSSGRRRRRGLQVAREEGLPGPDELAEVLEGERLLRDALDNLSEPYKHAVVLRYREGLSAAEIARQEGCPAGTVRWRIKTGLEQLRIELERSDSHWALIMVPLLRLPAPPAVLISGGMLAGATLPFGWLVFVVAVCVTLVLVSEPWDEAVDVPSNSMEQQASMLEAEPMGSSSNPIATLLSEPAIGVDRNPISKGSEVQNAPKATPKLATSQKAGLPPGCVQLVVMDESGTPLAGATAIEDEDTIRPCSDESGADGVLRIALRRQRKIRLEKAIWVQCPGFAAKRINLTLLSETETQGESVTLSPGGHLSGTVVDPSGRHRGCGLALVQALDKELSDRIRAGEVSTTELRGFFEDGTLTSWRGNPSMGTPFKLADVPVGVPSQVLAYVDDRGGSLGLSQVVVPLVGQSLDVGVFEIHPVGKPAKEKEIPQAADQLIVHVRPKPRVDTDRFQLQASYFVDGVYMYLSSKATGGGRHRIEAQSDQSIRIVLKDTLGDYKTIDLVGQQTSSQELTLEPIPMEKIELEVLDPSGQACDEFRLVLHSMGVFGSRLLSEIPSQAGHVAFGPPDQPYALELLSPMGARWISQPTGGAYDGPRSIRLLAAVPISGRVTRGGEPLEGSKVKMLFPVESTAPLLDAELLTLVMDWSSPFSITDGEGRFEFPLQSRSPYVICVEHERIALASVVVQAEPSSSLEIDVSQTGRIEGHSRVEFGKVEPGVVTAWNQYGIRRSVSYGPDGVFAFENLPPGKWCVMNTKQGYDRNLLGGPSDGEHSVWVPTARHKIPQPPSVVVSVGLTSHLVLSQKGNAHIPVGGRILINGKRPRSRKLALSQLGDSALATLRQHTSVRTGRGGALDFEVPSPGQWILTHGRSKTGGGTSISFHFEANTEGDGPRLDVDIATGNLVLISASGQVSYFCNVGAAQQGQVAITGSAMLSHMVSGETRVEGLPLGEVKIFRFPEGPDGGSPTPVASGMLIAGEDLVIHVP